MSLIDSASDRADEEYTLYDGEETPMTGPEQDVDAVTFDASLYIQTKVRVSLDNISDSLNAARDLDYPHATKISRQLLKYGSVKHISEMAIVLKEESKLSVTVQDNQFLDESVYIADGRYRKRAYEIARNKSDLWKTNCKNLFTSTRVDGQPITPLELIATSTFLNQQTGTFRPLTFKDTI